MVVLGSGVDNLEDGDGVAQLVDEVAEGGRIGGGGRGRDEEEMARSGAGGNVSLVGFVEGVASEENAESVCTEVGANEVFSSRVQPDSVRVGSFLTVGLIRRRSTSFYYKRFQQLRPDMIKYVDAHLGPCSYKLV